MNERLLRIESHLEVYESAIAGVQAKDKNDVTSKVSELRRLVLEAVSRRLDEAKR